jgi:hypothetical protein
MSFIFTSQILVHEFDQNPLTYVRPKRFTINVIRGEKGCRIGVIHHLEDLEK